jgi:hypothetical protein
VPKTPDQLRAENDRAVQDDVLPELAEELRLFERVRRWGEIVIRVGMQNGKVVRVNTEHSRTKSIGSGKANQ